MVADVAEHTLDIRRHLTLERLEPASRPLRRVPKKRANMTAFTDERFHQMAADETGGAGHENGGVCRHALFRAVSTKSDA